MGNCTRPTGDSAISVRVNGLVGQVNVDASTQTLTLTSFTFPNVTRRDNGAVFTCVLPNNIVIASLTLEVECECIYYPCTVCARVNYAFVCVCVSSKNTPVCILQLKNLHKTTLCSFFTEFIVL